MNGTAEGPSIYVDADACPVKQEIVKVAARHGLPVIFVANTGLRPSPDPMVRTIVVSDGFDAADDWIVANAAAGDIAVTSDVPLAARCVAGKIHTLSHSGRIFDEKTIGMASAMRDLGQHLRETGESKGYNAPFSRKDRSAFLQAMDKLARRAKSGL